MTSKEKAKELFDSYWYCLLQSNIENKHYWSQQCSLIAIDKMIEEISKWAGGEFQEWEKKRWKYLQEVKQEIEQL